MEHAILAKTTALAQTVGCGGVPDGFHGGISAGTIPHGAGGNVGMSYGSDNFSVVGGAGMSHTSNDGFSQTTNSASGTVYVCPSGASGNSVNLGFHDTHTTTSNLGFTGSSFSGGAISAGASFW